MSNTVIAEGKTTAEAIENGLKQLKVSKNDVDVTVLNFSCCNEYIYEGIKVITYSEYV